MTVYIALPAALLAGGLLYGQQPAPSGAAAQGAESVKPAEYVVETGVKIPLTLINSVSTKHSAVGDRVYLQSAFPILVTGRIVIPVGSYVAGTVTQIKKPGRATGKGELYVRFDSLTLPNGVTRDFHARIGGMDGDSAGTLDREEGKITSEGNRSGDLQTVGETTAAGTSVGGIVGHATGHAGLGIGIGAGAGAAAGLIGILASRGPDAVLDRGTTVEMVLDRNIGFSESELDFGNYQAPRAPAAPAPAKSGGKSGASLPIPGRRIP